ncbi:Zinc finger protein 862 [Anabarilius grahami]|uniref:Zinc finger protein 862 n=1 Tax=Anabarilius grahami TaxID=495550 RepID=A0A3N0XFS4_ANAGA|nr:Zinc finger protein 862 [Anabarilius grahami]
MSKRTIDSFFRPAASVPVPESTVSPSDDDAESEVGVAKKARNLHFREDWLKEFSWLRYYKQLNYMNCEYCSSYPRTAGNSKFADSTGTSQFKHKTLIKHNLSLKHRVCRDMFINLKATPLPVAFRRQMTVNQSADEAEMMLIFNTAYFVAKEELPFTKYKSQLDLQRKNGLKLNKTYNNDTACAQFVGVIADTLKGKTYTKIEDAPYLSIMIDGDTDVSTKECEIIYARILNEGKPMNILIGHIEVKHAHAQGVYDATKEAFQHLGTETGWLEKTVAMGADGAAVNLGHIVPFHCMPHRLELAMLSVQRKIPMVDHVYNLLNMVWKTYHFSSKSMRELRALGEELGVRLNVPGSVSGTRWLPHVNRALQTLLKPGGKDKHLQNPGQFTAVYYHMEHLTASSTNADIAGRSRKVKKMMEDGSFVGFCHFLADLFEAISKFSFLLQRNDVILPQAVNGIENLLATIEAMSVRCKPGGRLAELLADLQDQRRQQEGEGETHLLYKFQGITIKGEAAGLGKEGLSMASTPKLQQAVRATIDCTLLHLKQRFSSLLYEESTSASAKAVKSFKIFSHDSWPAEQRELTDYGAEELDFLLDHFSSVLTRNYMDKSYHALWGMMVTKLPFCSDYKNILHLVHIMLVLPVSSAICERGFSAQKRIKSDVRGSLHVDTVEDLIRISMEGPSLQEFDAKEAVQTWFSQGKMSRRPNYKGWPSEPPSGTQEDLL